MKKRNLFIYPIILISLLLTGSCEEDNDYILGADHAFVLVQQPETKKLEMSYQAQSGYCIVSSNARWQAESDSPWLTCRTKEGEFGDSVYFSLSENQADTRTARIVLHTTIRNEAYDTLTIIQAHTPSFRPEGYNIRIDSEIPFPLPETYSPELSFQVSAQSDWKVFCRPGNEWITLLTKENSGDGKVYFALKANEQLQNRQAYIYVALKEYESICDSLSITQSGRALKMEITVPRSKKMMMDERASSFSLTAEGDGDWKVSTDVPNWITFTQTEYSGNATIQGNVTETNSLRNGRIFVSLKTNPDISDTLYVTQDIIPEGRLKDSLALVALYYSANGKNWDGSWKLEEPLEKWYGVFMDNERVIDLSLNSNNLEGTLPEELGWLTEITKIKFYGNKLSGPIPASFNKLTKLTHIFMSRNKFSGQIPDLSALQDLELLDLTFNRIEGFIPATLITLPKLPYVKISYNHLDPSGCIPEKYAPTQEVYVNPQRAVYGDPTTDYNLSVCE